MKTWAKDLAWSSAGAGVGLASSVGARLLVPNPLIRASVTVGGLALSFRLLEESTFRTTMQGALVVSALVDLFHLKSWMTHADAPRGGVGALEAELTRATPWDAGHSLTAAGLRHPAASAVPVPA